MERGVEFRHHLGCRALLRAVDGARSARPRQRVGDVASNLDLRRLPVGVHAPHVDPRQTLQGQPAGGQLEPGFIEQVVAERLRHAATTVVGRTATDADDEVTRASVVRVL